MSKSKKKTKELEYAVKYLNQTMSMDIKTIALELGVAEAIVEGILEEKIEPKQLKKSKTQELMIRHTASKKINNVSIMTESASQLNDEAKKLSDRASKRPSNSIFRPNG
jgi:hypothetical protein